MSKLTFVIALIPLIALVLVLLGIRREWKRLHQVFIPNPDEIVQTLCIKCNNFVDVRTTRYVHGDKGGYQCVRCPKPEGSRSSVVSKLPSPKK